jgi:hypothetical protein
VTGRPDGATRQRLLPALPVGLLPPVRHEL